MSLTHLSTGRSRYGNRDRAGGRGGGGMRGGFRDQQRDFRKPFQSSGPPGGRTFGSDRMGTDSHRPSNSTSYSSFHNSGSSHSFSRPAGQDGDRSRGSVTGSRFGDSRSENFKRSNDGPATRSSGGGRWSSGANGNGHSYSSQPPPLMGGW